MQCRTRERYVIIPLAHSQGSTHITYQVHYTFLSEHSLYRASAHLKNSRVNVPLNGLEQLLKEISKILVLALLANCISVKDKADVSNRAHGTKHGYFKSVRRV